MAQAWYVTKRIYIQIVSTVLLNVSFLAPWATGLCVPVLHCYGCPIATFACPIGTLQYFITAALFPFLLVALMLFVGVVFGKLLCFYMCPFGFLQDLLFRLNKACIKIPKWLDAGKYVALFVFAGMLTAIFNEPFFCKICPAGILEAGIPVALHARIVEPVISGPLGTFPNPLLSMIGGLFWFKVTILVIILAVSIIVRRPFCRVLCPAGAIFVLLSKFSTLHLHLHMKECCKRKDCYER
jgi:polyferredoxin